MKLSAAARTLPLRGIEPPPPAPPKTPSTRTLRKRVIDAALAWIRTDSRDTNLFTNYARLERAARDLNERIKE